MHLMGANTLLAGSHQVESLKPDVELDVAAFHDALGGDAEILAALFGRTAVDARLLGGERVVDSAAMRADPAIGPAKRFKVSPCAFDSLEMRCVEFGHGDNLVSMTRN